MSGSGPSLTDKIGDVVGAIRRTRLSRRNFALGAGLGFTAAVLEGVGVSAFYPIVVYFTDGMDALRAPGSVFGGLIARFEALGIEVGLGILMSCVFVPMILRQFIDYARQVHQAKVAAAALAEVRGGLLEAMIRAQMGFHLRHHHGDLFNTLVIESKRAAQLAPSIITMTTSLSIILMGAVLLALFAPILAVLSIPLAGALAAVHFAIGKRMSRLGRDLSAIQSRSTIESGEILSATRLVKLRRQEETAIRRIDHLLGSLADNRVLSARAEALSAATVMPLGLAFAGLALYVGLASFELSLGETAVFSLVVMRILPQFGVFGQAFGALRNNVPGALAVERMIAEARAFPPLPSGPRKFETLSRELQFDDVDFVYRGSGRRSAALASSSFNLRAGRINALVGPSGAGKSTAIDLLSRLYDPTRGRILVDGVDLREFDLDSWQRAISVVSQETVLFHGSVRDNLRYGLVPEPSDVEIWAALEAASAGGFVRALPKELDEDVGDRGARLSGGQRQRLSLARALLARPQILILDEPTAALDSETEAAIGRTLLELRGNVTVIVVAHRLSTIQGADLITVLDAGAMAGQGTHEELLRSNALYRKLFGTQSVSVPDEDA